MKCLLDRISNDRGNDHRGDRTNDDQGPKPEWIILRIGLPTRIPRRRPDVTSEEEIPTRTDEIPVEDDEDGA
jgi:hypothetical protein